jgi:hypothetical protein
MHLETELPKSRLPVINLLFLAPHAPITALLCDPGAGPCKHLSFAEWQGAELRQQMVLQVIA